MGDAASHHGGGARTRTGLGNAMTIGGIAAYNVANLAAAAVSAVDAGSSGGGDLVVFAPVWSYPLRTIQAV